MAKLSMDEELFQFEGSQLDLMAFYSVFTEFAMMELGKDQVEELLKGVSERNDPNIRIKRSLPPNRDN